MSHDDSCQPGTQAKPGVHAAELPAHLAVRAWHPWHVTATGMLTGLSSSCRQADVLGQVQQASFTADMCQVILVPFSCRKVSVLVQSCLVRLEYAWQSGNIAGK